MSYFEETSFTIRKMRGTLTSATIEELAANPLRNLALIGKEWIQFTTVVDNGDGTYTLSGFRRGKFGTEHETGSHAIGEDFILFGEDTWLRIPMPVAEIGEARLYKVATVGTPISQAPKVSFTNTAKGLKPYSPSHLRAEVDLSGHALDWHLSWHRRTRVGGAWQDGVDVPLGEESEAYEVDILDGDGEIVRTLEVGEPPSLSGVDLAIDGATQTITRASGSFRGDGFVLGMWVRTAGFSNAANNSQGFRVLSFNTDGDEMTVRGLCSALVTESSASGRTVTAQNPGTRYTAAQQAADFGGNQAEITVVARQISAVVGRGEGTAGAFTDS